MLPFVFKPLYLYCKSCHSNNIQITNETFDLVMILVAKYKNTDTDASTKNDIRKCKKRKKKERYSP